MQRIVISNILRIACKIVLYTGIDDIFPSQKGRKYRALLTKDRSSFLAGPFDWPYTCNLR